MGDWLLVAIWQRGGVTTDPTCCLCEREEETLDHLFFGCVFSKEVWRQVAAWCGMQRTARRWEEEKQYMETMCTNNNMQQRLYRCMLAIVSYNLWKERNGRRMQNMKNRVEIVARQCQVMMAICKKKDRKLKHLVY